ncbi:MAG TPA: hypothetical protein VGD23_02225 [Sphingomicrobium sp.]
MNGSTTSWKSAPMHAASRSDLAWDLAWLGLREGDSIMVHASLKAIGHWALRTRPGQHQFKPDFELVPRKVFIHDAVN